jgi:hypothetical protein
MLKPRRKPSIKGYSDLAMRAFAEKLGPAKARWKSWVENSHLADPNSEGGEISTGIRRELFRV